MPRNLTLKPSSSLGDKDLTLDIIVHALGRVNFGCVWDFKGLIYPDIKLNGKLFCSKFPHLPLFSSVTSNMGIINRVPHAWGEL